MLYDTYKKRGACGRTGTTAEVFVLLGESNLIEILLLILQILQACNTLILAVSCGSSIPGFRPEARKGTSATELVPPSSAGRVPMKGLERVIKFIKTSHY